MQTLSFNQNFECSFFASSAKHSTSEYTPYISSASDLSYHANPEDLYIDYSDEQYGTSDTHPTENSPSSTPNDNILNSMPSHIRKDLDEFVIFCKRDWKKVSRKLARTHNITIDPYQLRMHFTENGRNRLPKSLFTLEQDQLLLAAQEEIGCNWVEISRKYFNDLCPMRLRNRFYTLKKEMPKQAAKKNQKKSSSKNNEETQLKTLNLKTLVSDIEFEFKPEWLAYFEQAFC